VSGIDPGWGNDVLPVLLSGLAGTIDEVRCQEIFDYSTYDQPDSVRFLVGMGQPMDDEPPMVHRACPPWCGAGRCA
jgi:2,4-diaminopentanoate dehydrogenase